MSALDGWMDIFRAGTHRDSAGVERTFTEAHLDGVIASWREADPVPVVVGHPKHNAPALGWIHDLRRIGDRLQARLRNLDATFREAVEAGRYGPRSVRLQPDGDGFRLCHLAFLGAVGAAVKGLLPNQYSEPEDQDLSHCYDFAEAEAPKSWLWAWQAMAATMSSLREWIIDKHDVETADRIVPQFRIDEIKSAGDRAVDQDAFAAAAPGALDAAGQEDDMGGPGQPADSAQREAEFSKWEQRRKQEEADYAARVAALKEQEAAADRAARERQAEQELQAHVAAGRVLPAEAPGLAAFMAWLPDGDEAVISFSEPAGKDGSTDTKTQTPRAYLSDFLSALPQRVPFGVAAGGPLPKTATESDTDDTIPARALAYQARLAEIGVDLDIVAAVDAVRMGKDK